VFGRSGFAVGGGIGERKSCEFGFGFEEGEGVCGKVEDNNTRWGRKKGGRYKFFECFGNTRI
jgi:hypothetical protein